MIDNKFPIGKYEPQPFSQHQKNEWINDIEFLPQLLENAIINLDKEQLRMPYRDGGWNSIQVVHHVADSHMNSYIRFKLALTENNPTIKPYLEAEWAKMVDTEIVAINVSITLLFSLHKRWVAILKNMTEENFRRTVFHPEHQKEMTLWFLLGMYAWHGKHHTAHINNLRRKMKW